MGNETSLSKDSSTLPTFSKNTRPRSNSDSKLTNMMMDDYFAHKLKKEKRVKNNFQRLYKTYKIRNLCQKVKRSILHSELIDKVNNKNIKNNVLSQLRSVMRNKSIDKDLKSHFEKKPKIYGQVLEDLVKSRVPVDPFVMYKLRKVEQQCKARNEQRLMKSEDKHNKLHKNISLSSEQYNYLLSKIKNLELQVKSLEEWKKDMKLSSGLKVDKKTTVIPKKFVFNGNLEDYPYM